MELNAIISKTLRGASIGVIKKIQVSDDLSLNNFVVVPDRFSFQAEKLIFQTLNIKSTFNINVVSVSKLSNLVLKLLGKDVACEKKLSSIMRVYSILLNYKNQFKTFSSSKINFELASDLYLILAQFKSSGICVENLKDEILDDKLYDILLLYEKYESYNDEILDANDVLNIFASEIENSEIVRNSNFYFLEFDALTKQVFEVLKNLVKFSRSVTVGVAFTSSSNDYVYEKDIFNKLGEISNLLNVRINSEIVEENFSSLQKLLAENVYSFSDKKIEIEKGKINIIGVSNEDEEIKRAVEIINFEVKDGGKKFSDFNIVLPNISKFVGSIEKYFALENIPYFVDEDHSLSETLPIKFLNSFFEFFKKRNIESFLSFAGNVFSKLSNEEVKQIYLLNAEEGLEIDEILQLKNEDENLNVFFEKTKKCLIYCEKIKKIDNLIEFLNNFFEIFEIFNTTSSLISNFENNGDLKNLKIYQQIEGKFETLVSYLSQLDFIEEIETEEIIKIFNNVCQLIKISSIPLAVDCVFIGQSDVSYFEEKKIFIFIGCNQGQLPCSVKDVGILNDTDIEKFKNVKIEPSVRMLNRRNKFKLFCDVCLCREKLFLILLSNSKEQENDLVVSFKSKFICEGKNIEVSNDFYTRIIENKKDITFKLASNFNRNILKKKEKVNKEVKIENVKQTFFKFNSVSDTKIQDYFKCPFYAFVKNALKVKERESAYLDERDIGNVVHKFCELYVLNKRNNNNLNVEDVFKKSVSLNERTKRLYENNLNGFAFSRLLKEIKALAVELERHEVSSLFVPYKVEQKFSLPLCENINLVGKIDRIDKADDVLRVLDYKTGKVSLSLSKLYYGLQIQLPLYMYACKKQFGCCVAGLYFPVNAKNMFFNKTKLSGYFLNEKNTFALMDKNLKNENKSDVLDLTFKKNDAFVCNAKNGVCTEEELDAILAYSIEIAKVCIAESLEGKFSACPCDETVCQNCYLYKICSHKFGEKTRSQRGEFDNSTFQKIFSEEK